MPTISAFFGIVIQMFWREAVEHRQTLLEDWDLCSQLKPPKPIPPLE